ncbi:class I SAM-dependent methyltransferase [Rhodobacteraceae bacterium RKSG542]|uniref:class I SAM-dependent methyltransferase n=1 Tax=Pseudovibrio flavus TaxID=2529854 RepID=UPI0012BD555B|nr:class I SAM-dependent methyltransferase [Pseudovibrio flavus]MTI16062.1 class I SAM-dependent methyltransferase [Pseudovibrio flavus]
MSIWNDEVIDWYVENFGDDVSNQTVIDNAPLPETADVLDIGCGNGYALRLASSKVKEGTLVGVEPFERMLDHARAASHGHPADDRIIYARGSAEDLPFEDDKFDVVMSLNAVHHWADLSKGFAEAFRTLKVGGQLIVGGDVFDVNIAPDSQDYTEVLKAAGFEEIASKQLKDSVFFITTARKGP